MDNRLDTVTTNSPERHPRVVYGTIEPGAYVYGYPEAGGIYVLNHVLGVELDFLGLDRFDRGPSPEDNEEEHCNKMRQLGARYWETQKTYDDKTLRDYLSGNDEPRDDDRYLYVGWPVTGGVWVLNVTYAEVRENIVAVIHNAFSMQERCTVIEALGGNFYKNPKDCEALDLP